MSFGTFGSTFGGGSSFGSSGGGFGSQSTFGSATPAFGSSTPAFGGGGGAFGSTPSFGSTFNSSPSFGTSTPAFGTAGGFGSTPSTFGGSNPFGSSSGGGFGSTFGSSTNTFGSTPAFGSSTPAFGSSSNMFSQPAATPAFGSGTFGAPSSTFNFGSTPSNSMFGTTSSTFGSGSMGSFGSSGMSSMGGSTFGSGFGSTPAFGSTGSTFGSSSSGFGSTFGGFGDAFGGGGGQKEKFQVTHNEGLAFHSISSMKNYANKSFEELRWEHQGGAPAQASSPFGSSTSTFGTQQASNPFGSTSSSPFGTGAAMGSGGMFGATANSSPFSFGSGTSSFGSTTASPFGSSFGNTFGTTPTTTPSFGSGFGSFSSAPATSFGTSPFGASSGGGFGSFGATTGTNVFGASTSPFSFGSTSTPSFGTTSSFGTSFGPAGGGGFGTGFGTSSFPTSSFMSSGTAPSFGTSGFSSSTSFAPSTGFGFSAPSTTGTSFGTGGFNFGATTPSFGGSTSFGMTTPSFSTSTTSFGTSFPSTATSFLGAPQMKAPEVNDDPYGLHLIPLNTPALPTPVGLTQPGTSVSEPKPGISGPTIYRVTPRSAAHSARMRPRRFDRLTAPLSLQAPQLQDRSFDVGTPIDRPFREDFETMDLSSRRSLRKLNVVHPPKVVAVDEDSGSGRENSDPNVTPNNQARLHETPSKAAATPIKSLFDHDDSFGTPIPELLKIRELGSPDTPGRKEKEKPRPPTLTRENYFTSPDIRELGKMTAEQLTKVKDFKVIHKGYGSITWKGLTDVTAIDLDKVVVFGNNTLQVFPDETVKVGHPLNAKAEVTLEGCWPENKSGKREATSDATKIKKYEARLRKMQKNVPGVHFKEYDPQAGRWSFTVDSF